MLPKNEKFEMQDYSINRLSMDNVRVLITLKKLWIYLLYFL
jgi:hypothetical protein